MSSHSTTTPRLILCYGMTEHLEKKMKDIAKQNRQKKDSPKNIYKTEGECSPA